MCRVTLQTLLLIQVNTVCLCHENIRGDSTSSAMHDGKIRRGEFETCRKTPCHVIGCVQRTGSTGMKGNPETLANPPIMHRAGSGTSTGSFMTETNCIYLD